jgi:hypothetical protein
MKKGKKTTFGSWLEGLWGDAVGRKEEDGVRTRRRILG